MKHVNSSIRERLFLAALATLVALLGVPATPASAETTELDAVAAEPEVLVSTRGLTKRYGKLLALDQLDLDVPRGAVFGFIGPNGAGKSTTFAILATLLRPTAGTATVCGADPIHQPREVRRRLGYMPDVMGVYDQLRVDEYLSFHAAAYRIPRNEWRDLVEGLLELVELDVEREAMVDSLSQGMKQRLFLAVADAAGEIGSPSDGPFTPIKRVFLESQVGQNVVITEGPEFGSGGVIAFDERTGEPISLDTTTSGVPLWGRSLLTLTGLALLSALFGVRRLRPRPTRFGLDGPGGCCRRGSKGSGDLPRSGLMAGHRRRMGEVHA